MISTLFISHGSPMRALPGHPTTQAWAELGRQLPRPRAIVVASAHWNTRAPAVGGAARPELIYDFGGFPASLYQLRYPAFGEPALAQAIAAQLREAGFAAAIDPARGLDHGVWVPLLHLFPGADIPVVPLAVQPQLGPDHHLRLGRALQGLAGEDVLLIGSGSLTHNLHDARLGDDDATRAPAYVAEFSDWIAARLAAGDADALCDYRRLAPAAARAHPTDEHFLPLFVALGAAGPAARSERLYSALNDGAIAMDLYRFSAAVAVAA